jgi:uncharacterized protein (DUF2141 family)
MKVLLAALLLLGGLVYACEYADINNDRKVDVRDIGAVAKAFGTYEGHPNWNPAADINNDGKVDVKDLGMVCKCFGYTY